MSESKTGPFIMCAPCGCSVPTPCAYGVVVGGNRVVCYQEASEMMNFLIKKWDQHGLAEWLSFSIKVFNVI